MAVVGLILLIGLVAIASIGILTYAGTSTTNVQQELENERIEEAFVELSQTMTTTASTGDTVELINFNAGENGAIVKADTGEITIEGGDVNETFSVGAIEYEGDDGTRIAYQAGAVFRETGEETQIVSAPPMHYDAATESFSFPIVKVEDEDRLDSGDVRIRHERTEPHRNASLVQDDTVTITITSEYYRGWESYLRQQAGGTIVRDVTTFEHNDTGIVTAELGYVEADEVFDSGITVSREPGEGGNVDIDDEDFKIRHESMRELDSIIYGMVQNENTSENWESAEDGPWTITGGETFTHGTYFADGIHLDGDTTTVNLEEGDVTLVVDGDIWIDDGTFSVENGGDEHVLRIYTTGNFYMGDGTMGVEPLLDGDFDEDNLHASYLQLYGTSEMSIGMRNGVYEGILYAPSNNFEGPNEVHVEENVGTHQCEDNQACFHSNPEFYGGMYVSSAYFQGGLGSLTFEYDEDLKDADIELYPDEYELPPRITYLNVNEHIVDVEGD